LSYEKTADLEFISMKKTICLFLVSLFSINSFSQVVLTENQKLESLCKVWGFLKYYHPVIIKGKTDWDQQLIKLIPEVISTRDKQELSNLYLCWIGSLGSVTACRKSQTIVIPNSLKYNLNIGWLKDQNLFSDSLIEVLDYIYKNRSQRINYNAKQNFSHSRVSFENRQPYIGMVYPEVEYRLLSLFRFWNVINYYFPYKYVIGEDWNIVLTEMIDRFKDAKDTVDYHLALAELTATINDSHSGITTKYILQHFGSYQVPFQIKIINEKAVVIAFYNDSLSNVDEIRHGDVILSVNNKPVSEIIAERSKYISASNLPRKLYRLSWFLLNGNSDSARITFDRDGKTFQKCIHRYKFKDLCMSWKTWWGITYKDTNAMVRTLNDHIGYINMGKLTLEKVRQVMTQMMTMDAIIFDLRNYPNGTAWKISKYLSENKKAFAIWTYPLKGNPGIFQEVPDYGGSKNSHHYKGKVVILVNELTISQSEYSCMLIQAVINTTIVGSQTAGADGDIAIFTFPGGYETAFSGHGIFYPDGRETQRIGIVPDIKITQTIDGIRNGKDEILDRAIQFLSTGR